MLAACPPFRTACEEVRAGLRQRGLRVQMDARPRPSRGLAGWDVLAELAGKRYSICPRSACQCC